MDLDNIELWELVIGRLVNRDWMMMSKQAGGGRRRGRRKRGVDSDDVKRWWKIWRLDDLRQAQRTKPLRRLTLNVFEVGLAAFRLSGQE